MICVDRYSRYYDVAIAAKVVANYGEEEEGIDRRKQLQFSGYLIYRNGEWLSRIIKFPHIPVNKINRYKI